MTPSEWADRIRAHDRTRRRSRALLLAAALLALSCSKRSKPEGEPVKPVAQEKASASTSAAASASPAEAPLADPIVELVDAGKAPRSAMRIRAPQGAEQRVDLAMLMKIEMSVAGSHLPTNALPRIHMPLDVKVDELRPDGTRKVSFAVDHVTVDADPTVSPSVVSVLSSKMAVLDGLHGFVIVTDRGFNRGFSMDVPPDAPPLVKQMTDSMRQSLGQIVSPFPEEPVGIGAKWSVAQVMRINGMTMKQKTDYEIVDRKADVVSLKIAIAQTADPQDIAAPGLPPGAKVHLETLDSSATGSQTIDLAQAMPRSAKVDLDSDSTMTIDDGAKKQPMEMHMVMSMQVAPP